MFRLMKALVIFYFLILFGRTTAAETVHTALCFLTTTPAIETVQFAEEIALDAAKYGVEVFIVVTNNRYKMPSSWPSTVKMLQIPDEKCVEFSYTEAMVIYGVAETRITAWDKAFLYFCELNQTYSFVWFVESDVFIPTVHSFFSIHQLYSRNSDLVMPTIYANPLADTSTWYHWNRIVGELIPPWYNSMVNGVGMSRRLLTTIRDSVRWTGHVVFHEALPQTLAMNLNMKVVLPTEFETLVFQYNYGWDHINTKTNNWWHPVKNTTLQHIWRQRITNEIVTNISSSDWLNLTTLCNNTINPTVLRHHISKLTIDFDRNKAKLSPNERRSLRQHFLLLAKQCEKLQDFESARTITLNLADSAYKLPEPSKFQFMTKSAAHLMIENALVQNKQHVYQFSNNSAVLLRLREEYKNLTSALTDEIRRELKEQHNQTDREKTQNQANSYHILMNKPDAFSKNDYLTHFKAIFNISHTFAYNNAYYVTFVTIASILFLFIIRRFCRFDPKKIIMYQSVPNVA